MLDLSCYDTVVITNGTYSIKNLDKGITLPWAGAWGAGRDS